MTAPTDRAALIEVIRYANQSAQTRVAEDILNAIEAAGVIHLPKELTKKMQMAARSSGLQPIWDKLIAKFYEELVASSPYKQETETKNVKT